MKLSLSAFCPLTGVMVKFVGAGRYTGLPHPVTIGRQSDGHVAAVSDAWHIPSPHNTAPGGASVALQYWLHVTAMLGGAPMNVNPNVAQSAGKAKLPFFTTGSQQHPGVCASEKRGIASVMSAITMIPSIMFLDIVLPVMVFLVSRTNRLGVCFCLLHRLLC